MDWLEAKGASYVRVNGEDFLTNASYQDGELTFDTFDMEAVTACWYRRSISEDYFDELLQETDNSYQNSVELKNYLAREYKVLKSLFFRKMKDKHWLSHPRETAVNKLDVLDKARSVGLTTPSTLATTSKTALLTFIEELGAVISKPMGELAMFWEPHKLSSLKTCLLSEETIASIPDRFFPTLFQEKIEKQYEIRAFYLDGHYYAMAIFSQKDEKTAVDFRNYNVNYPNRTTPYLLPDEITAKLDKLVALLGMTTGSFDLIKDKQGDYVFLEINPIGQFGMTSKPCNYFLEEKIATYLMDHER
jgi:ATP-GRASP peptide maturase of grasp-with-spasm system